MQTASLNHRSARYAYEKISTYEDTVLGREARVRRVAAQLEKIWPPMRPKKRRPAVTSSDPMATPAAATSGVEGLPLTTTEPASAGSEAGATPPPARTGGRREGEYIDTQRTVQWLRGQRHGVRWLAKQLGVSHAHMRSVLVGLSKLSYSRCRKLEALTAISGAAVA